MSHPKSADSRRTMEAFGLLREELKHERAIKADLLEALINARSILNVFGGDLTKYPKSEADAGRIDAIMWTAQDQIRAAIAKATGQGRGA